MLRPLVGEGERASWEERRTKKLCPMRLNEIVPNLFEISKK